MIQVNRIYLIFNRLVTKKFLVDTSDVTLKKDAFTPFIEAYSNLDFEKNKLLQRNGKLPISGTFTI